MLRLRPQRVALRAALGGAQAIEREPKRNADQPSAKTVAVTKAVKTLVRPEQRLLGHVFRIRGVAQDATRDAKGQRAAFGEALFEFPPGVRLSCLAHQLAPGCADWLDQNQLLHRIPSKLHHTGCPEERVHALPVQLTDAVVAGLVHCENRRTSTASLLHKSP